jgi:hypothetical protein
LDQIAIINATVDEIKNNGDVSDIKDEVANLDAEVEDILEKLGELLAANAVIQGDLRIANLGNLEVAQDLISIGDDDPEVTVQGNLYVVVNATNGLQDSLEVVNKITNKIRIVQQTVTVTTNSAIELNALTYVAGNYDISGTGSVADAKLRTINGSMSIDLGGDLDYSQLNSVNNGVTISQTSTVTAVDFGGVVSGNILTGTNSITLPNANSVKIGGVLPTEVNLAAAVTFESTYVGSAQTTTTIVVGGANATFSFGATAFTGGVTITTTGDVSLPQLTNAQALNINAGTDATIDLSGLTAITAATTLSATTVNLGSIVSSTDTVTLVGPTAVSLPALTTLGGDFVAAQATSFSAPLLATSTGTIDLNNNGATVELESLTATSTILDIAVISELTLAKQAATIDISDFVNIARLNYTGDKPASVTPGSQVATNNLTITSANASLTTLVIGASGGIGTLTVSASTLESLSTAGIIINAVITNNAALATFDFQHTHVDGDDATNVNIVR